MNDIDWDKPSGSLYRLGADIELSRRQGAVICANGLGWSPDDRTFYFGESFRYAIFAYDFEPDAAPFRIAEYSRPSTKAAGRSRTG